MTIIELAQALGQSIKDSVEMQRMNAAEAAYEADEELQALVAEYRAQELAASESADEAFTAAINARMEELYARVQDSPVWIEYIAAQAEVSRLMNLVNNEINYVITGERGGCSGSCDSCSGCH